jgi:hypothetical protein
MRKPSVYQLHKKPTPGARKRRIARPKPVADVSAEDATRAGAIIAALPDADIGRLIAIALEEISLCPPMAQGESHQQWQTVRRERRRLANGLRDLRVAWADRRLRAHFILASARDISRASSALRQGELQAARDTVIAIASRYDHARDAVPLSD